VGKKGKAQAASGNAVSMALGQLHFEPFGMMESVAKGRVTMDAWQDLIAKAGIVEVDLGNVTSPNEAQ
jgi:hypothetical protein